MATIRIAKIMYDHHEVVLSKDAYETLGQQIDKYIVETLAGGSLVSEVSLFFEGEAEQVGLMDAYAAAVSDHRGYTATADDGPAKRKTNHKLHRLID